MDKLTMGDRIKEARKKNGLTQEQLAERLDVSVEFVGQIERGLKLPSMQVFIKIIEALNVSADYLLRDSVSTGQLFGDNAIGRKIEKHGLFSVLNYISKCEIGIGYTLFGDFICCLFWQIFVG